MSDEPEHWYEYGYRLVDGEESWAIEHGSDGTWTAWDAERNIEAIDIYLGSEVAAIYRGLDKAGVEGMAIRRLITRTEGPTEDVPRETVN